MKIIFLLLMSHLTVYTTSDSHSFNCSKTFLTQGIQITCKQLTDGRNGEPKFVIKLKQHSNVTSAESDCTTTNNTITCQRLIFIENIGIGQHKLFAIMYSTSGQVYSYTAEFSIILDFPKIAIKNCAYDENDITAHCTCERNDASEIETWIYLYINDVERNRTSGKSLQFSSVINGSTALRCAAENIAGWRSNTASVFYKLPKEEATDCKKYAVITFSIFLVTACVLYYIFSGRNMINTETRLTPLVKTNPFYNDWSVSENNVVVNTEVEVETPPQQRSSTFNVKDHRHEEALKEDKTLNKDCIDKGIYTLQSKLHTNLANCKKNPGHKNFVPVNQLSLEHFPSGYHDNDVYDLTKALADLTIRIAVKFTSPDRPEFVPGTKDPYPCYNTRGQNLLRTGTGRVWKVTKYTEGMKWGYRTCPCPECDHSDTPSKEWWEVQVMTAKHVVFDSSEARHSICRLWFDEDECLEVNIYGCGLSKSDSTGDWCWVECVTHDLNVGDKMRKALKRFEELRVQVSAKMKFRTNVDKLAIIVSHPHGCSKQVSVGHWVHRQTVNDQKTRYCYTSCTCPGSSGAAVYRLGTLWSEHPHSGASNGGLNYSGVWVD